MPPMVMMMMMNDDDEDYMTQGEVEQLTLIPDNPDAAAQQCQGRRHTPVSTSVGQLSQTNRAAACVSFGKNISAKSVHLTSLYPTAQKIFRNAEPFRRANQLSPMFR